MGQHAIVNRKIISILYTEKIAGSESLQTIFFVAETTLLSFAIGVSPFFV
jgi:hypothetical protein